MKDYVEVNEEKCGEVHNCMCVKSVDGKTYCRGCGSVIAEHINSTKHMEKYRIRATSHRKEPLWPMYLL